MKKFLIKTLLFFGIPLVLVLVIYWLSDPFKTNGKFDLADVNTLNREYLSTELYLKNEKKEKYDSFIFGSSRGCGINTYKWKAHLPEGSSQFLFQAWAETVTGILQKIKFLDRRDVAINNTIILLDIPASFSKVQEPTTAIALKHYALSGKSKLYFHTTLFVEFLKPSEILKSLGEIFEKPVNKIDFDTISNDWNKSSEFNWTIMPKQDSTLNKRKFGKRPKVEIASRRLISAEFETILRQIAAILKKHNTDYRIIVTPSYNQLAINPIDLKLIQTIFSSEKVFDYSGKNWLTEDKFNFSDIHHFDEIVGWKMLEDVYKNKSSREK